MTDDWYEEEEEEDDEDMWVDYDDGDPCRHCGPHCPEWGGDGLCMVEIRALSEEADDFTKRFVTENYTCPVCGKGLTLYSIPVDTLWEWPGGFYNPMIALDIYGALGVPKGELHRDGNLVHIWVGEGEYRSEKLVQLMADRFSYTANDLTVYEGATAFWIAYQGEERCMGDGTDMFYSDEKGPIRCGTPEFYELLRDMVDKDAGTLIEAYFGKPKRTHYVSEDAVCRLIGFEGNHCLSCHDSDDMQEVDLGRGRWSRACCAVKQAYDNWQDPIPF
jgi:hypothetical protein